MGNPRISGRRGQELDLDVIFYHNGTPTNPYAIRSVKIYHTSVTPANLVETITVVDPWDTDYPSPVSKVADQDDAILPGQYALVWTPPATVSVPNVFIDVWEYYVDDPRSPTDCGDTGSPTECDLDEYTDQLLSCCHRFWVYPDEWFCSDNLETIELGFEPLNMRFFSPEIKPLQVGIMPLPLYDYNASLILPLLPYAQATITVRTQHCETIIDAEPMTMGLRSGSYRSNPYVFKWTLDTSRFLKGTYQFRVTLTLPDGSTRVSPDFNISIV